ncbi:uncharacterized protein LOC111265623 [Varroa jacobsoni]|uniref:uncharacterized protein LOC111265623 n=1 Tax=Varroa jacobsoni TaxID=62625 RepID=UPI000BF9BA7C|nr:uncharacterized protein LOC111265623 [Varroa jacobsoni]
MMSSSNKNETIYFSVSEAPDNCQSIQSHIEGTEDQLETGENIVSSTEHHYGDDRCRSPDLKTPCDMQCTVTSSVPPIVETQESGMLQEPIRDNESTFTVEAGGDLPLAQAKAHGVIADIANEPNTDLPTVVSGTSTADGINGDFINPPILTAETKSEVGGTLAFELYDESNVDTVTTVEDSENMDERPGHESGDTGATRLRELQPHVDTDLNLNTARHSNDDDVDDWSVVAQAGSDDESVVEGVAVVDDRGLGDVSARNDCGPAIGEEAEAEHIVLTTHTDRGSPLFFETALKDSEDTHVKASESCLQVDNSSSLSNEGSRPVPSTVSNPLNRDALISRAPNQQVDSSQVEKTAENNEDLYGPRVWEVHAAFLMAVLAIIWIVVGEFVNRFTAWMNYAEL